MPGRLCDVCGHTNTNALSSRITGAFSRTDNCTAQCESNNLHGSSDGFFDP